MDIGICRTSRPKPAANRKTCMSCLCYLLLSPSRAWPEQSQPSHGGSPRRLWALPVPHLPGIIPLQSTCCHWCMHAGGGMGENPAGLLMAPGLGTHLPVRSVPRHPESTLLHIGVRVCLVLRVPAGRAHSRRTPVQCCRQHPEHWWQAHPHRSVLWVMVD